jgi:polyhydroxyalkanoate synthesis regulator phasin
MNTKILESKVKNLCDELRKTGKFEPADYYEKLLNRITAPSNEIEKDESLQEIISSGKISDLANFTIKEDRLLDLAYAEAKKLKQ